MPNAWWFESARHDPLPLCPGCKGTGSRPDGNECWCVHVAMKEVSDEEAPHGSVFIANPHRVRPKDDDQD